MATIAAKTHRFGMYPCVFAAMSMLLIVSFTARPAMASLPIGAGAMELTSFAAAPNGGYWIQVDGGVDNDENGGSRTVAVDGAPQFESVPYRGSIAAIPGQEGYWIVTDTGAIYARGSAPELCDGQLSNCSGFPSDPEVGDYISAAAASPDGKGLWAVSQNGKVWTAGTTRSYGDVAKDYRWVPTGIAPTLTGHGYYIVLNDGGVYSFGDAVFHGSTGGEMPGGHDATGIAVCFNLHRKPVGYWMVASDGGVFTFGDAPFLGSTGGNNGGSSVTNIAIRSSRPSYAWVHQNGGVGESETLAPMNIENQYSETALGIPTKSAGAELKQYHPDPRNPYQQWDIWPVDDTGTLVQIVNLYSGLCLDVTGYVWEARIIQFPCKGEDHDWFNQLWYMNTDGGLVEFTPYGDYPTSEYRVGSTTPALGAPVKLLPLGEVIDPSQVSWFVTNAP